MPAWAATPTDAEIAGEAELPVEQVEEVRAAARTVTSLDRAVGEEGDTAFGDLLPSDEPELEEEIQVSLAHEALRRTVSELPEAERRVIRLRYGIDGERAQAAARDRARAGPVGRARAPARVARAEAPRPPRRSWTRCRDAA